MSRRLIIGILVVLIIGVVGGAAVLVVNRLREGAGQPSPTPAVGQLPGAETGGQQVVDPTADADGDGLNNGDEQLWGANLNNADTDGDGTRDGEEVQARRNPTIPGPNDVLPTGFVPGRNITPLETVPSGVAVDQFFERNLDLNLSGKNYTNEYRSRFGENDRTAETLSRYVQEQTIVTKLPTPLERAIQAESQDTRVVLGEYLAVAGNLTSFSNPDVVESALNDLIAGGDPASVRGLALQVRLHQEELLEVHIPPSAVNLHRLLLGYSELLSATYDVIAGYPDDPVKAAVAMRQLEENDRTYIPLITQELERVQAIAAQLSS